MRAASPPSEKHLVQAALPLHWPKMRTPALRIYFRSASACWFEWLWAVGAGAAKPPPLSSRLPNRRISCSCHTFGWLGLLRIALRISSRLSGMPAQDYALARGRYGPSPLVGRLDSSSNRRGLSLTLFIPISFASPISAFPQFLPAPDVFFA